MSGLPDKAELIAIVEGMEAELKEAHALTCKAAEAYQQEQKALTQFKAEAEERIREIKLTGENTANQVRRHIAKMSRQMRRDLGQLRSGQPTAQGDAPHDT